MTLRSYCLRILTVVTAALAPTLATSVQASENPWNLCAEQTARWERQDGIPRHLLTAISLAESGRWDQDGQVNVAWPWTVTSQGVGRFFATKQDAVTHVLELWARGVENIDVGCMQINQYYHGAAFTDIEQALDPSANVAYAARFLKKLFADTRSWTQAAAHYHSTNPDRHVPYKLKVIRLWNQERRGGVGSRTVAAKLSPRKPVVGIDIVRTARLNARLKAAREAERSASGTDNPAINRERIRIQQLKAWREAVSRSSGMVNLAAIQRAQAQARQKPKFREPGDAERFDAKRKAQLKAWRDNLASGSGPS